MKQLLITTVNGQRIEREVDPSMRLVDFLRDELFLTGTKIGCKQGECGACTIIMDGTAVLSCILPVMKAMNTEILTIEGIAEEGKLHPIQDEFVKGGAIQCGFCTPGLIMGTKALLDHNPSPTREEVREDLSGHICRCTGYKKIEDSVMKAAERMREENHG